MTGEKRGLRPYLSSRGAARTVLVFVLACCAAVVAYTAHTNIRRPDAARPDAQPNVQASAPGSKPAPPPPAPPADQSFHGRGDRVVRLAELDKDFHYIATITHDGSGNFAVNSRDADGKAIDLLVNEIGDYSGTRPISFDGHPHILQIKADGSWTVIIKVAQKAAVWTGSASGTGDAVFLIPSGTLTGLSTAQATHAGAGNFAVTTHGRRSDLLVNEIGKYSGEVLFGRDTFMIEIVADGAWTFNKS